MLRSLFRSRFLYWLLVGLPPTAHQRDVQHLHVTIAIGRNAQQRATLVIGDTRTAVIFPRPRAVRHLAHQLGVDQPYWEVVGISGTHLSSVFEDNAARERALHRAEGGAVEPVEEPAEVKDFSFKPIHKEESKWDKNKRR